jgi:hypothetical protein
MSVPVEALSDYREFAVCPFCDFAGIGTVTVIGSDYFAGTEAHFTCDVCERSHNMTSEV